MGARRVVLAAGGTGGHMFPAQALAQELIGRGWQAALITDRRGFALASDFPADPIETIEAASINPRRPFKSVIGAFQIASGFGKARKLIRSLQPEAVVGFGGYPAFPGLAAARGRCPIIVHEQNAVLGRVNRVFAGRAAAVASGFERLERLPEAAKAHWSVTGNPVRGHVLKVQNAPYWPSDSKPMRLLVLGGSQGARILAETTPKAVALLPENMRARLEVVQQTREDLIEDTMKTYQEAGVKAECRPFFADVGDRLAAAHLVVARAGASTVTELAVLGRPAVLVPLAIAMDDHQTLNAEAMAEAGAADVIAEKACTPKSLSAALERLLSDPAELVRRAEAARSTGRPKATKAMADLVEQVSAKAGA